MQRPFIRVIHCLYSCRLPTMPSAKVLETEACAVFALSSSYSTWCTASTAQCVPCAECSQGPLQMQPVPSGVHRKRQPVATSPDDACSRAERLYLPHLHQGVQPQRQHAHAHQERSRWLRQQCGGLQVMGPDQAEKEEEGPVTLCRHPPLLLLQSACKLLVVKPSPCRQAYDEDSCYVRYFLLL